MFRIYSKGAINTLSNQANYHTLGKVLYSAPFDAKCSTPIMRTCKKNVMGPKVKGENWSKFGSVELIVERLESKEHFHN